MTKAQAETLIVLARECPNVAPRILRAHTLALFEASRALQRLAMIEMNERTLTDAEKLTEGACWGALVATCQALGISWEYGDARGGTVVQLRLPSRLSNNMGGETWGILP